MPDYDDDIIITCFTPQPGFAISQGDMSVNTSVCVCVCVCTPFIIILEYPFFNNSHRYGVHFACWP